MNREQKKQIAESLRADIEAAGLIALVDYRGVTVEEINAVRRKLESLGVKYVVAKNSIVKKVIEGTERENLGALLNGMTGLIISGEDAVAAAKNISEITKEFKDKKFILKGGFFDGDVINAKGVEFVSTLPSKEELLTMLLRTVQEGPRQVLGVIQGPARDLVNLLKNYEHKLEDGE